MTKIPMSSQPITKVHEPEQFYQHGEPLFDAVYNIRKKTSGEPIIQVLQTLYSAGYISEISQIAKWLTKLDNRLKNVCIDCCGDCLNCGVMPVVAEINGALDEATKER